MAVNLGIIASSKKKTAVLPPVAGYNLWLDASDATTFTYSSGSLVSAWADKSTYGYNMTQSTVGYQPTRTLAAQNGLPAVTFTASLLKNASLSWGASTTVLFIVAREDKTAGTGFMNLVTTGSGSTGEWGYGIGANSSGDYISIFDIGQNLVGFNTTMSSTNADVLAFESAGISGSSVTAALAKNGTNAPSSPTTLTNTSTATGMGIGSAAATSEPFTGYICEVILYPFGMSGASRASVESYLKTKWGTP
jgi:hypothetical protein